MRLTLTWFGLEVDLYLGPSTVDDDVLDSVQDTPTRHPGASPAALSGSPRT